MAAQGPILTNKYAENYPGRRYYGGTRCGRWSKVSQLSQKKSLVLNFANVQPHSGRQTALLMALIEPGDTVLGMDLAAGGHLTHRLL